MKASKLRIAGSDFENAAAGSRVGRPASVRVTAGETLALLLHAARMNRAWLNDFADETIEISSDLYEVLLTYKRVAIQENSRAA